MLVKWHNAILFLQISIICIIFLILTNSQEKSLLRIHTPSFHLRPKHTFAKNSYTYIDVFISIYWCCLNYDHSNIFQMEKLIIINTLRSMLAISFEFFVFVLRIIQCFILVVFVLFKNKNIYIFANGLSYIPENNTNAWISRSRIICFLQVTLTAHKDKGKNALYFLNSIRSPSY